MFIKCFHTFLLWKKSLFLHFRQGQNIILISCMNVGVQSRLVHDVSSPLRNTSVTLPALIFVCTHQILYLVNISIIRYFLRFFFLLFMCFFPQKNRHIYRKFSSLVGEYFNWFTWKWFTSLLQLFNNFFTTNAQQN